MEDNEIKIEVTNNKGYSMSYIIPSIESVTNLLKRAPDNVDDISGFLLWVGVNTGKNFTEVGN
jgi:hypothetical protein